MTIKGQMTIFDILNIPCPGQWLDDGNFTMGEPIDFDDLQDGMLIWANKSTESHEWWKCLKVRRSVRDSNGEIWRKILDDGTKHPELHNRIEYHEPLHGIYRYRKVS